MSYNGWIRYRRGIMEHVLDGRLTGHQHYALSQLILMADASTGGYNVNAPILCYWCGYCFNLDTAEKILKTLHDKRYVWYRGLRGSKHPQPYWVNKYLISRGRLTNRMTDLSQLFDKSAICQQDVDSTADETTDQPTDETTDQPTDNYKTGNKRKNTRNNFHTTVKASRECITTNAASGQHQMMPSSRRSGVNASRECNTKNASNECITKNASSRMRHSECVTENASSDMRHVSGTLPIFVTGEDPHYKDPITGQKLQWDVAQRMIEEAEKGAAIQ